MRVTWSDAIMVSFLLLILGAAKRKADPSLVIIPECEPLRLDRVIREYPERKGRRHGPQQ